MQDVGAPSGAVRQTVIMIVAALLKETINGTLERREPSIIP
jgi:hypothetical protein